MPTNFESIPELQGFAPQEAERRYKRASLQARMSIEDQTLKTAFGIWCVALGIGGGLASGVHSVALAAGCAAAFGGAGQIVASIYHRRALAKATRDILRTQAAQTPQRAEC